MKNKPEKFITQDGIQYVFAGELKGKVCYIENPHVGGGFWFVLENGRLTKSQEITDFIKNPGGDTK